MRFATFEQVADWYNRTPPIKGERLSENIRPIGQRRRAWERIEKVDDNCYMLTDGWGLWGGNKVTDPDERVNKQNRYFAMAPIVWESREDGEYVRIRNSIKGSASISRYRFLQEYAPVGLRFDWDDEYQKSGKHSVTAQMADGTTDRFFIPKFSIETANNSHYVTSDSGEMLWFKRVGHGTWERVGELMAKPTQRVNKELYAQYKPHVDAMYEWMGAVLPVLGALTHEGRQQYVSLIKRKEGVNSHWFSFNADQVKPDFMREVLTNFEHPARVAVAVLMASELRVYNYQGDLRLPETLDAAKYLRTKFVQLVRKVGEFNVVDYK